MVKNQTYQQMTDLLRNRTCGPEDAKKHAAGEKLQIEQIEHGHFEVESESYNSKFYSVKVKNTQCDRCIVRCPMCKVCICLFQCECPDNNYGTRNVCKHIHAVMNSKIRSEPDVSEPDKSHQEELLSFESMFCRKDVFKSKLDEVLNVHASLLTEIKETKNLQLLETTLAHLKRAKGAFDACRDLSGASSLPVDPTTSKEPVNTNVVRQDKFHSTKKKNISKPNMKAPSVEVKKELKNILLGSKDKIEVPYISSGRVNEEHSY